MYREPSVSQYITHHVFPSRVLTGDRCWVSEEMESIMKK